MSPQVAPLTPMGATLDLEQPDPAEPAAPERALAGPARPKGAMPDLQVLAQQGLIDTMLADRAREVLEGRASPVEFAAGAGADHLRPQHGASRTLARQRQRRSAAAGHVRLASLGPVGQFLPDGSKTPLSLRPDSDAPANATPLPAPGELKQAEAEVQLASLGPGAGGMPDPAREPSLSGGIRWLASADCLAAPLRRVIAEVAAKFGPLRVNSTCRSKRRNARVGGASRSYHLTGNAADFRITGSVPAVLAFLKGRKDVGGLKHYGFGLFHIDNGPRRTWGNRSWGKRARKGGRRRS